VSTSVRPATPADHEAIRELTVGVYVGDGLASAGYLPELANVEARAAATEMLVAEVDGHVVGAVALAAQGGPYAENAGPGEAVFRMLVVERAARGRGIAEALVRACLIRAAELGATAMVISSQPQMAAAHRLYERLGFRREPSRDWSPRPGVDLLAYTRPLP